MKLSQHVARTGLAAGLAIAAASAVASTTPATAQAAPPKPHHAVAPMHASCLDPVPPNYDTVIGHALGGNVALRTGTGTNCAVVGQAQMGDDLDYYCYLPGPDGHSWTYVKDLTTGRSGWIRNDLLSGNGSHVGCGS
jgi:hypothetical protein